MESSFNIPFKFVILLSPFLWKNNDEDEGEEDDKATINRRQAKLVWLKFCLNVVLQYNINREIKTELQIKYVFIYNAIFSYNIKYHHCWFNFCFCSCEEICPNENALS